MALTYGRAWIMAVLALVGVDVVVEKAEFRCQSRPVLVRDLPCDLSQLLVSDTIVLIQIVRIANVGRRRLQRGQHVRLVEQIRRNDVEVKDLLQFIRCDASLNARDELQLIQLT